MTVIAGYRLACDAALAALESGAVDKASGGGAGMRDALLSIARTTLSSKILTHDRAHFAELAVEAVTRLGADPDLDAIHILKKAGGSLPDSFLADGFILDKAIGVGQPKVAGGRGGVVGCVGKKIETNRADPDPPLSPSVDRPRPHPGGQHRAGHGQSQNLWGAGAGRLAGEGGGARSR
jgi:chaperonin GroEL (HSP60 family)